MGVDLLDQKFEWDAGGIFTCPDTDSFSARCQNREGHSPLAMHTAAFVHVLVLLAAGFALCFGQSINLTWLINVAFISEVPRFWDNIDLKLIQWDHLVVSSLTERKFWSPQIYARISPGGPCLVWGPERNQNSRWFAQLRGNKRGSQAERSTPITFLRSLKYNNALILNAIIPLNLSLEFIFMVKVVPTLCIL